VDEHQVVLAAQFLDGAALGCYAVLLFITAAVSTIGPNPVSGLERTGPFFHSPSPSSLFIA
jgi:hypothetical protein